jgi:DNA-binding IclR family transcriptional regulator
LFDSHGRIAGSVSIVVQSPRASDIAVSRLGVAVGNAAREIERMRDGGAVPNPGGRSKIRSGTKA